MQPGIDKTEVILQPKQNDAIWVENLSGKSVESYCRKFLKTGT
jgi:hypothetical protein